MPLFNFRTARSETK